MPRDSEHLLTDSAGSGWTRSARAWTTSASTSRRTADEAFRFFCGPHDFMYDHDATGHAGPDVPHVVQHHRRDGANLRPHALLHQPDPPGQPPAPLDLPMEVFGDPMVAQAFAQQDMQRVMFDQVRGASWSGVINWSPNETDLRGESRLSVDEALIKGRGVLWTEIWQPPGAKFKVDRLVPRLGRSPGRRP
jgi:hypothetical protein